MKRMADEVVSRIDEFASEVVILESSYTLKISSSTKRARIWYVMHAEDKISCRMASSLASTLASFTVPPEMRLDPALHSLQQGALCFILRPRVHTLQALADVLYSFAILHCDHQQMVDSILTRILFDLKRMSPAALSQLVSGLHVLHHRSDSHMQLP